MTARFSTSFRDRLQDRYPNLTTQHCDVERLLAKRSGDSDIGSVAKRMMRYSYVVLSLWQNSEDQTSGRSGFDNWLFSMGL